MKIFSLQLSEELAQSIKDLAKSNNINFSNQIRLILTEYLRKIKND